MSSASHTGGGGPDVLDKRDAKALTETISVIDWIDRARGAPGLYEVITQSGSQYLVDLETGSCECPDARYRDRRCKHLARVESRSENARSRPGSIPTT